MHYRKLSANYIFSAQKGFINNGILLVDNDNRIIDLIDPKGDLKEESNLEYYNGIIVPGFVNVNSFLELSYLKEQVSRGEGSKDIIRQITGKRIISPDQILKSAEKADEEMRREGVKAAADIALNNVSHEIKIRSSIIYQTFTCFPNNAGQILGIKYGFDEQVFKNLSLYSVYEISKKIFNPCGSRDSIFLMHIFNSGLIKENLIIDDISHKDIVTNSKSSKPGESINHIYQKEKFSRPDKIILPFDCFSKTCLDESIDKDRDIHLVICPKSDYFINMHDFYLWEIKCIKSNICLGTGSLATNGRLSIIDEMQFFQKFNDQVNLGDLLKCATLNGAKALGIDFLTGSFEKGKQPGINLIENADLLKLKLTPSSKIRVLIS